MSVAKWDKSCENCKYFDHVTGLCKRVSEEDVEYLITEKRCWCRYWEED